MKQLLTYLRSRQFFIHLGIVVVVLAALVFASLRWLSAYTNHGEYTEVPDFVNAQVSSLEQFTEDKHVSYKIIDSLYDPSEKPGIVLRQDPEAGSKVKHNRTVYLYVTGMVPPQIMMPKLVDRSERQARLVLTSYGLKPGKINEVRADCDGCVLEQLYKGHIIEAGKPVPKGSRIDLLIGRKDAYFTLAGFSDTSATQSPLDDE